MLDKLCLDELLLFLWYVYGYGLNANLAQEWFSKDYALNT